LIHRVNSEVLYDPVGGALIQDTMLSDEDQIPSQVFGAFAQIKEVLEAFQSILPQCIKNLKDAKTTVNHAQASIHSIFSTFKGNGPPIFYAASKAYDMVWALYFVLLAIVTLGVLYYGFHASNIGNDPTDESEPGCCESLCSVCCACFGGHCIGDFCFWTILIVAQIGILVLFLVAIVLCILAGVKSFVASGCSQIYILVDEGVCTETLKLLQKFMQTFSIGTGFDVNQACQQYTLMACQELGPKMATSASLTIIGGLGGAVLSFQMLVDVAKLHVRARCQRERLEWLKENRQK